MKRLFLGVVVGSLACLPATRDDDDSATPRYQPLAVGASWTYRVEEDDGTVREKTNTVEGVEDVGGHWAGTQAFRVKMATTQEVNLSYFVDTGMAVQRLRDKTFNAAGQLTQDEYYTPYKLRLDEQAAHLELGGSWSERYEEHVVETDGSEKVVYRVDQWTVEAVAEVLQVPAGQFPCLRLRRTSLETSSDKTYWFARGVGKAKEVSGGQTETLASFTLP